VVGGRVGRRQAFFIIMLKIKRSDTLILFSYFIILIILGSILLKIPIAWEGKQDLPYIDALFTSTSAVCVTGLITVDTAQYSLFGKIIILILIQFGGLGIITFTTIYLALPSRRLSLTDSKIIKQYYLDEVETKPTYIIRQIVTMTLIFEITGAVLLFIGFYPDLGKNTLFFSIFHAISAFCNAGFSTFSNNLENYVHNPLVCITIMSLIVLGGLGFVTLRDLIKKSTNRKRRLTVHTKLMVIFTSFLIISAASLFFILESNNAVSQLNSGEKILACFFQAVTPRTAGFNTIVQSKLTDPSKLATITLMFIGGGSASTAGGVKVSTFFLVIMSLWIVKRRGDMLLFKKRIPMQTVFKAAMFLLKALSIIFVSIFILCITELVISPGEHKHVLNIVFEAFSAFGTVGLSLGVTPNLSGLGKMVIILTMFAGRVGLISMAMAPDRKKIEQLIEYPDGEVLIG
jgi:trk system potassium uptake protein TrkH